MIAMGLGVVALAYGVGRIQGAVALNRAEEQVASERLQSQARLAACEVERGLLTARRSLSLVALALDRRNFGVAESHRRDALKTLEQPTLAAHGDVSKLASVVRSLNLGVDPDPGAKREQVIAVSEQLDRVSAAHAAKAAAPAVSTAAPN